MNLLWYPVHPCSIPFLLINRISLNENGAIFHENLDACSPNSYQKKEYSFDISKRGDLYYDTAQFSMALLVEVDAFAAQDTQHKETETENTWYKPPSKDDYFD
jgi:hypothetical protein